LHESDSLVLAGTDSPVNSVAFLQCVGSRDRKAGAAYCSQACCAFALRLANLMKFKFPDIDITIFYMDIQSPARHFDHFVQSLSSYIHLVRGLPGEVLKNKEDKLVLRYEKGGSDILRQDEFDLIVLSVGFLPALPADQVIDALNLKRNEHGFLSPLEESNRMAIVGTAIGPMNIMDTMAHSRATAGRLARNLTGISV